jgi:transketolase
VTSSTLTSYFAKRYPSRFFNMGVTEAAMVNVGVGLALAGKIPFVNTFAGLLTLRACEQIRTCVAYAQANVKLVGGYAGVSDYKDGPTHFAVNDVAVMRAMPGMVVVAPADNYEAACMVKLLAEYDGPAYMRISRAATADVFDESYRPALGKGVVLRPGRDVTLVACGSMVGRSVAAAGALAEMGIAVNLVAMSSIKPLDEALLLQAAAHSGAVVTAEEHLIAGGLGSAVAETLARSCPLPLEMVGLDDSFARTGPDTESLMDACGLAVEDIILAVQRAMKRKAGG